MLTEQNLAAVLEEFGYARYDEASGDLAEELRRLSTGVGATGMLTGAFMAAERYGFGHSFECWLADVLLARQLGWAHAIPLLGTEAVSSRSAGRSRS